MSSREKMVTSFGLVVFYFTLFQGGAYFARNIVQEFGIATILVLWAWNAYQALDAGADSSLALWIILPLVFIVGFVGFYSLVFWLRTGANPIPSIFALRYFVAILVGPTIVFTHQRGFDLDAHERLLWISLCCLLANYTLHYFLIDLAAANVSDDRSVKAFVVYDEWRGYRLKPNYYTMYMTAILGAFRVWRAPQPNQRGFAALITIATISWLIILLPRAGVLTISTAVLLYLTFIERGRIAPLVATAPLLLTISLCGILWNLDQIGAHFASDWSYISRAQSTRIALASLKEYPLFGFGTASYYTFSYQDVFGKHFYPGDIGLLGMAFRNGLIGAAFYLSVQFYMTARCIRTAWIQYENGEKPASVVATIATLCIALTMLLPIQPALAFNFGFPIAGLALGFATIGRIPKLEVAPE